MPDLEWKATAIADLLAIVDYISDDNPDAAQALKDEIEDKTSRLPNHPQMYRVGRVDGTREMVVRPNYIVIYAEDRLCCTNQLRDSLYESSVVAGGYEQLVPYEVQDQELAFVQHGAKAARFAINLV